MDNFASIGPQYWLFQTIPYRGPVEVGEGCGHLPKGDKYRAAMLDIFNFASVTGYWA